MVCGDYRSWHAYSGECCLLLQWVYTLLRGNPCGWSTNTILSFGDFTKPQTFQVRQVVCGYTQNITDRVKPVYSDSSPFSYHMSGHSCLIRLSTKSISQQWPHFIYLPQMVVFVDRWILYFEHFTDIGW